VQGLHGSGAGRQRTRPQAAQPGFPSLLRNRSRLSWRCAPETLQMKPNALVEICLPPTIPTNRHAVSK